MRVGKGPGVCARCLLAAALPHPPDAEADSLPAAGQLIGSYRILRPLGEGGMGVVYLAQQEHPIARQVALKFIKLGMDTRAVLARFQSEQQVLALMDHPNIAQVHEAGSDPRGRPYFVMEYVPGIPLTEYCDLNRLDTRQRLELFLKVVNAVQHAHQKGIIHRDLKPSNILVVDRDGEAVPKIIDFGLAKAIARAHAEESLFTQAGVLIGTPEYMSPEQAWSGSVDLDTRTDIYSLGVLLYEVLVGTTPFDSKTLRQAGFDEIRRVICEENPPSPASRLKALGAEAAGIASFRSTDAGRLRRLVRGDLDWITMKALEKEPSRRYPSASELSADIGRHLRDEPVAAASAGPAYRFFRFARQNRPAVAGLAALLVGLLLSLSFAMALIVNLRGAKSAALRVNYSAKLAAAVLLLDDNQPAAAQRHLIACDLEWQDWEWRYLWRKCDSSLTRLLPPQPAGSARPDFPTAIGFAGTRMCWSGQTTVECREGPAYASPTTLHFPKVLALSPDGALAVIAADGIKVVETASGKPVSTCRDCPGDSAYAVINSNRTRVAVPDGHGTIVWDIHTDQPLLRLPEGQPLAFSPDGNQLVFGGRGLALWRVLPPARIASLFSDGDVHLAAFSSRGDLLAASADGAIHAWHVQSPLSPTVLAAPGAAVRAIAVSPDGRRVAAGGDDRSVRIWLDNRLVATLAAFPSESVQAIAFSADGTRLAAGSRSGELAIWDATTSGGEFLPASGAQQVTAFAVSPDGARLAVAIDNGSLQLWGIDGSILRTWPAHAGQISAVAFSPDGRRLVSAGAAHPAQLWDAESGRPGIELRGHHAPLTAVAFSPDGKRIATGAKDGSVTLWDSVSGIQLAAIQIPQPVNSLAFSPAATPLLIASGDPAGAPARAPTILLWEPGAASPRREFRAPESCGQGHCAAYQASISGDGQRVLAVLAGKSETWVWDSHTGAPLARLRSGPGTCLATFNPLGNRIATATPHGSLQIWDAHSYRLLLTLPGGLSIGLLSFSSDGTRLFGSSLKGVRIWDTRTAHSPERRSPRDRDYPWVPLDL